MKCIIIEDQPPAQRILKKYIADIGSLELMATFSNALQAIDFLKSREVDIIFLDIHLPKLSGLDFLKTLNNSPAVILTTAFPDYALESYEFNVVDYLLKPFSFDRFVKAVLKVPSRKANKAQGSENSKYRREFFIKSGYEYVKIPVDEIYYINSDQDYTEVVVPGKKHLASEPLKYWEEALDPERFARVHKSYIVNATHIRKVSGSLITLTDGTEIPIGRAYKEDFVSRFIR